MSRAIVYASEDRRVEAEVDAKSRLDAGEKLRMKADHTGGIRSSSLLHLIPHFSHARQVLFIMVVDRPVQV